MKHHPAILLDVEGTMVPISFIYEMLFPYARRNIRGYLTRHASDPEIQDALLSLKSENVADRNDGSPEFSGRLDGVEYLSSATEYCLWLMDHDRKTAPLKTIQGRIWEQGFGRHELQGEIFPDVYGCFSEWHRSGCRIAIYSSGSVLAQKLVLGHTSFGNLLPFVEAFFDTKVGSKKNARSYERIAGELTLKVADVLFVSDVGAELDAASAAGMDVALSVRPGNAPVSAGSHYRVVHSLTEL